ncbi:unnamed protein product [Blepharisma stoltei]|uniref:Uncharacterized protein n=1 Tax=Blepharisma stoltei TaxID=1481888 RepID=A0AAU9ISL6_9CILI|nr:unnamed protein product [Blepharisma stoltei]
MGCVETREHKVVESKSAQTEEESTNLPTFYSFASTLETTKDARFTSDTQTSTNLLEEELTALKLEKKSLEHTILALSDQAKLYEAKSEALQQSILSLSQEVEKLKNSQLLCENENKTQKEKILELNDTMKKRSEEYNQLLANAYDNSKNDKIAIEDLKRKNFELEKTNKVSNFTMIKSLQHEIEQSNKEEKLRFIKGIKAGSFSFGSKEELRRNWRSGILIEEEDTI